MNSYELNSNEQSRNDVAQRHWKVFDGASFCGWFLHADLVSNACCDIVVVSALCSSRRGHMHTMSTADGSVTSPSYGDAGGTLAAPPTFRRTFVLRKLPSDGILASCTGVLHDTSYCWRRN